MTSSTVAVCSLLSYFTLVAAYKLSSPIPAAIAVALMALAWYVCLRTRQIQKFFPSGTGTGLYRAAGSREPKRIVCLSVIGLPLLPVWALKFGTDEQIEETGSLAGITKTPKNFVIVPVLPVGALFVLRLLLGWGILAVTFFLIVHLPDRNDTTPPPATPLSLVGKISNTPGPLSRPSARPHQRASSRPSAPASKS